MKMDIKGIQQAQTAAIRALAAVQPSGGLGRAIRWATAAAHRFAVQNTVVDTGSWRASQTPQMVDETHGRVFINPDSVNPKSRSKPSVYGPILEARKGGRYAVYQRTYQEAGPDIVRQAGKMIESELP